MSRGVGSSQGMSLTGRLLADFTQPLALGATDVAAGGFELVIDDIANRAGFPACSVKTAGSFQFLVPTFQPSLRRGQSIKARRLLMDDRALGLYKDLCAKAYRVILAFAFDN